MPEIQGGSGTPAPSTPAVDVAAVAKAVADALRPDISAEITGAVKRNVASAMSGVDIEAIKALLTKGQGGAAPEAPTPQPGTVKAVEAELLKLKADFKAEQDTRAKYQARALREGVAAKINASKVTSAASELLIDKFASLVKEGDDGGLYVTGAEGPVAFESYLTNYLKDKAELLQPSARAGSGAGSPAGTWSEAMPKTRTELLFHTKDKTPDGKPLPTPARASEFKRLHPEVWKALPT